MPKTIEMSIERHLETRSVRGKMLHHDPQNPCLKGRRRHLSAGRAPKMMKKTMVQTSKTQHRLPLTYPTEAKKSSFTPHHTTSSPPLTQIPRRTTPTNPFHPRAHPTLPPPLTLPHPAHSSSIINHSGYQYRRPHPYHHNPPRDRACRRPPSKHRSTRASSPYRPSYGSAACIAPCTVRACRVPARATTSGGPGRRRFCRRGGRLSCRREW